MRTIDAVPSKSDVQRALICEALSGDSGEIIAGNPSEDIEATKKCLTALRLSKSEMYCGQSGSAFRFLLPVMGALGRRAEFYQEGRLPERPLAPLYKELVKHGCRLSPMGSVPFVTEGKLKNGVFHIDGNVSSQFVSGLLFALPLLEGDSVIIIGGELQSRSYVEMTVRTLSRFGVDIETRRDGYFVRGGQKYKAPPSYKVEGDWSNSAFWLAAGAFLRKGISVRGLDLNSPQGDRKITEILRNFGANVMEGEKEVIVSKGELHGTLTDVSQIPDLAPVISVLGAGARGETRIINGGRLRYKESDRIRTITEALRSLGGKATEQEEGLTIFGTGSLRGGEVSSFGDHRIAMMIAVASLICEDKVLIRGSDAVRKSYPAFFDHLDRLHLNYNLERI